MKPEISFLDLMDEPDDDSEEFERPAKRKKIEHVPRESKGPHLCIIEEMGICAECKHLLYVHSENGGCFYRQGDCPCTQKRPLPKSEGIVSLEEIT